MRVTDVLIVSRLSCREMALVQAHILVAAPARIHKLQSWHLPNSGNRCTLVPGFPERQDVWKLSEAPWSPAVPQESRLGDAFEDCMPPTCCRSEHWVLGLESVNATEECGSRGKDDVKRGWGSCWTWREPQNMEATVVGVDGNNTEIVGVSGRQGWCVSSRMNRGIGGRWREACDSWELFMDSDWDVTVVSLQSGVVPTVCAWQRRH